MQHPCVVEEKLDGANVALWLDPSGLVATASRAGVGSSDRARQFGRLRAWAASHAAPLHALLSARAVLYAEWLYREHTVAYDALPDLLIALDLWSERTGFTTAHERDRRCRAVGIATPPVLFRGTPATVQQARALHRRSVFGREPAEGLVLRFEEGERLVRRAKLVRPGFTPKPDAAWAKEPARTNTTIGETARRR